MQADTIHILGAGSIGLLLGARLAGTRPVVLIRRPGQECGELAVRLLEGSAERRIRLLQCGADSLAARVNRLIVCTKAYDALPALEGLAPWLENTQLLLMQNGMGSQQAVVERFPRLAVSAASSTEGAFRPTPTSVVHAGRGITRIGPLRGESAGWVELLRAGGLAAEPATPIEWHLANKLRVNALINPLTVVYRCRNGELLEHAQRRAHMQALGAETDTVLEAAGYCFADSAFDAAADVARRTAANYSSMYQDARAGRQLEIDYINGYLCALGEQSGVAAPLNRALVERLSTP